MNYNSSYLTHFIVGLILLITSVNILATGECGGIFFSASGAEAYLNGMLALVFGLFLIGQFLFVKEEKKFGWVDALWMTVAFWGMEIVSHFIFRYHLI